MNACLSHPGGGAALLHLAEFVPGFRDTLSDAEEALGAEIVRKALLSPARLIANNAGVEGDVIVERLLGSEWSMGYNAVSSCCAMGKSGMMIKYHQYQTATLCTDGGPDREHAGRGDPGPGQGHPLRPDQRVRHCWYPPNHAGRDCRKEGAQKGRQSGGHARWLCRGHACWHDHIMLGWGVVGTNSMYARTDVLCACFDHHDDMNDRSCAGVCQFEIHSDA